MSYKSPVILLLDSFDEEVVNNVYQIVNHYFVDVDKDELLKALRYDRDQYNRGRLDGYHEAKKEIVQCKDCKYFERIMAARYRNGETVEYQNCRQRVPQNSENFYCGYGERKETEE